MAAAIGPTTLTQRRAVSTSHARAERPYNAVSQTFADGPPFLGGAQARAPICLSLSRCRFVATRNLAAFLARFAESVVIDSRSTDKTREIAESFGARIVHFASGGRYPPKRN
jgi:hypothetical protein